MSPASKKPKRSTAKTSPKSKPSSASRGSKRSVGRGSAPPLFEEWIEFLRALHSAKATFLIVGGHAVAVHGEPRLTEDLDILLEPSLANAERVRDALVAFGFGSLAPPARDLTEPRRVIMLGRKPRRASPRAVASQRPRRARCAFAMRRSSRYRFGSAPSKMGSTPTPPTARS